MDFLSNLAKGDQSKPPADHPTNPDEKPTSNTDLLASAKVVAEAAEAQFRNTKDKAACDTGKVAVAAADLVHAAGEYGKLDETKGVGKYVDQAEDYLRQYNAKPATDAAPTAAPEHKPTAPANTGESEKPATTGDVEKPASGGAGEYLKIAEDYMKKPAAAEEGSGGKPEEKEGGYGDLMKKAGGFFKK